MPAPKDPIKYKEWKRKIGLANKGINNYFYGKHHSEKTKKKIGLANKGNKTWLGKHHSEETKIKMSLNNKKTMLGKHHTKEQKLKIGLAQKGNKHNLGNKHSEEWKKNMSLIHSGNKYNLGKKHTKEHNKKISLANKGINNYFYGKHRSEEQKEKIREALKGEKCHLWKGGISFEPYTLDFNKRFKKAIRERDGCCMLCNINFEDLHSIKRRVHVHHIDYNKLNSFQQNCIILCNNCHMKTNFNRNHWTKFFHSLLTERYKYEYTEDQKIILDFTKDKSQ